MTNQNLYNLSKKMRQFRCALEENIDAETGEVNGDFIQQLQLTKRELNKKAVGYAYVIKSIDDEAEAYKKEIERLTQRKKQLENAKSRLKQALVNAMVANEIIEIKGPLMTLKLRKSESVDVFDMDLLANQFKRIKYDPDKPAIKEAIKNGIMVEGAELVINQNLQIK